MIIGGISFNYNPGNFYFPGWFPTNDGILNGGVTVISGGSSGGLNGGSDFNLNTGGTYVPGLDDYRNVSQPTVPSGENQPTVPSGETPTDDAEKSFVSEDGRLKATISSAGYTIANNVDGNNEKIVSTLDKVNYTNTIIRKAIGEQLRQDYEEAKSNLMTFSKRTLTANISAYILRRINQGLSTP